MYLKKMMKDLEDKECVASILKVTYAYIRED